MRQTMKAIGASRSEMHAVDPLRSVLVALDLSPGSDRVVGRVRLLPLDARARVTLLHVVPGSLPAPEQQSARRDAQRALAAEVSRLREAMPGARIEGVVKVGNTVREIAGTSAKMKAELVVVGRGGGRLFSEAFLGSTAERVLRNAHLPVLVVRKPPRAAYQRPAIALDLDAAAKAAVRLALRLLPSPPPKVSVVHAFDVPYRSFAYPSLIDEDEADEATRELRAEAHQRLTALVAAAAESVALERPLRWKAHVAYGSPRLVVSRVIRRNDNDLLVLGSRAQTGMAYAFLGTVAGDLLRAAKCDVLAVPARSARA